MIRRPPRSTRVRSSAASDVYKRQKQLYIIKGEEGGKKFRTQAGLQGRNVANITQRRISNRLLTESIELSYVASQLTALKAILSIKDADATDHKSKIAQPVSLVTNMKQLLGDLDPAKLCTQPGPLNAVRLKETLTALLHTCPVGMSAIAGPLHQVMEQSGFQHLKVPPARCKS